MFTSHLTLFGERGAAGQRYPLLAQSSATRLPVRELVHFRQFVGACFKCSEKHFSVMLVLTFQRPPFSLLAEL